MEELKSYRQVQGSAVTIILLETDFGEQALVCLKQVRWARLSCVHDETHWHVRLELQPFAAILPRIAPSEELASECNADQQHDQEFKQAHNANFGGLSRVGLKRSNWFSLGNLRITYLLLLQPCFVQGFLLFTVFLVST